MLKKFVLPIVGTLAVSVLTIAAPTTASGAPAAEAAQARPILAPGRFADVRIGESLDSAAESAYFDLDVPSNCGSTSAIGPTKKWRKAIDIYPGFTDGTREQVGTIGVSGPGVRTREGIQIGSTLSDLQTAYGDRLRGPRTDTYDQYTYFVRVKRRWLGFLLDATGTDGPAPAAAEIKFMEATKGRRPSLMRDGC